MHDPKFENEVQKKLEELSFSPSEAVWTRVERAVNEKRRRRLPLFWFFLLPSLGLAGAGIVYFSKHRTTQAVQVVRTVPASAPAAAAAQFPSVTQPAPGKHTPPSNTLTPPDDNTAAMAKVSPDRTIPQHQDKILTPGATSHQDTPQTDIVRRDAVRHDKVQEDKVQQVATHQDAVYQDAVQQDATHQDAVHQDIARTTSHVGLPGLRSFDHVFAAPTASRLAGSSTRPTGASAASAAKTPINLKPKYSWEMGFAGGVGLSTLNSSLFQQPAVAASDVQALTTPTPVNAAYNKTPTSNVRPDISYWAGIVAQRPLSRALTLSLGLDLHYYSTRQQIGEAVYNNPASLYQASTYFTQQSTANQRAAVFPYYSVGDADVFVNRYYFLELPASVLWKVNHSRSLPLFWENGLSLSYMVSTSSIYYNAKSGVFYKDQGSMANKTQLNLSTALLVGLPIKNMRLQAGPQLQYGLTSLQHQSSIGQHLFYGGIRIVLIPGKMKK